MEHQTEVGGPGDSWPWEGQGGASCGKSLGQAVVWCAALRGEGGKVGAVPAAPAGPPPGRRGRGAHCPGAIIGEMGAIRGLTPQGPGARGGARGVGPPAPGHRAVPRGTAAPQGPPGVIEGA